MGVVFERRVSGYRVESEDHFVLVLARGHWEALSIGREWLDEPPTKVSGPYRRVERHPYVNPTYAGA